ncbi:MAG TPA: hypothetical protein PLT94_10310 [Rhodocyclaceae bacterium]|nr:hypothetical protein [Rhodocyclaceae bacterium]HNB78915.1 hypothetical protein [Rhodocyclaceae bacterium]HNC61114.1 hypothetical protein [Rhodocyclaceae bacterium]HNG80999.1 hypothetical protein [Burkholderiaceae bacterium]HNH99031.1 hypothetical protein [Rhodocyclaceae bacterium]
MNHHADAGSIRVWELNWHWNADGFDARFRRPAWLENLLAGLQSGRHFDGVHNSSQRPAALGLRTFNSRLAQGSTPPPNRTKPQPETVGVFVFGRARTRKDAGSQANDRHKALGMAAAGHTPPRPNIHGISRAFHFTWLATEMPSSVSHECGRHRRLAEDGVGRIVFLVDARKRGRQPHQAVIAARRRTLTAR